MTVQNFTTMDGPKDAIPKEQLHYDLGNFRKASSAQILPKSNWQGKGGLKM